ncbi:MAG: VOC family protein [Solirubrobacteraceae bacterium]
MAASAAYRPLLAVVGTDVSSDDEQLIEWGDFGLSPADAEHPATTGVHVGLVAADTGLIDAFWRAGLDAGLADDGAPGPRTGYGADSRGLRPLDYYGGFLRDHDGNSIEACVHGKSGPPGVVDHVWVRVADAAASRDFYAAIAPFTGFALVLDEPRIARFRGPSASFTVLEEGPPSANLHMAFPAGADAVVRDFHAAALAAGARDNGAPGERPVYHPGYYGAFVLDPDGQNVEVVNHHR